MKSPTSGRYSPLPGLIRMRECSGNEVAEFANITHVNATHIRIERKNPAEGPVCLLLRSESANKVLIVEGRDDERMLREAHFLDYPINLGLALKCGRWNVPPLIASTSGKVDQIRCLTRASLAARTAAVACLSSSVPSSQ